MIVVDVNNIAKFKSDGSSLVDLTRVEDYRNDSLRRLLQRELNAPYLVRMILNQSDDAIRRLIASSGKKKHGIQGVRIQSHGERAVLVSPKPMFEINEPVFLAARTKLPAEVERSLHALERLRVALEAAASGEKSVTWPELTCAQYSAPLKPYVNWAAQAAYNYRVKNAYSKDERKALNKLRRQPPPCAVEGLGITESGPFNPTDSLQQWATNRGETAAYRDGNAYRAVMNIFRNNGWDALIDHLVLQPIERSHWKMVPDASRGAAEIEIVRCPRQIAVESKGKAILSRADRGNGIARGKEGNFFVLRERERGNDAMAAAVAVAMQREHGTVVLVTGDRDIISAAVRAQIRRHKASLPGDALVLLTPIAFSENEEQNKESTLNRESKKLLRLIQHLGGEVLTEQSGHGIATPYRVLVNNHWIVQGVLPIRDEDVPKLNLYSAFA